MKIKREIKVAIFGISVLFAAYWGVNMLKGLDIFSSSNTIVANYTNSGDIEVSAPVLIKGVKVGTVTEIDLSDINSDIKVHFTVDKKYSIPDNTVALISSTSLLGGKSIILEIGNSSVYVENEGVLKGELDNNMTKQIDEVKDQVYGALNSMKTTLDKINSVLDEETINNLTSTVSNVNTITKEAAVTMKSMSDELTTITDNLESITSDFKETTPYLKSTIKNVAVMTDSLNNTLPMLTASVTSTLNEVDSAIKSINDSKGSIGMMLNDKSLYNNLDASTNNLSTLLLDLKENPSRYVQLSVFGRRDPITKAKEKAQKKELKAQKKANK